MGAYSFTSGVSVKTTGMFWNVFFWLCNLCLQSCGAPLIVTCQKSDFIRVSTDKHLFNEFQMSTRFFWIRFFISTSFLFSAQVSAASDREKDGSTRSPGRRALVLAEQAAGMWRTINPLFPSRKPYPGLRAAAVSTRG